MKSNQIKWLPLRLNIIPLIDKQTKMVLELYMATRKQIIEGDILAISRLNEIRQQAEGRVKAIDQFYVKYAFDPRTKYIYTSRAILAKISQHHSFQNINQHDYHSPQILHQSPIIPISQRSPQNIDYSKISNQPNSNTSRKLFTPLNRSNLKIQTEGNDLNSVIKNSIDHQMIKETQKDKDGGMMFLSDLQKKQKTKTPVKSKKEEQVIKKGSYRKIQTGAAQRIAHKKIQEVEQLQREKLEVNKKLQYSPFDIKKSFKDLSELVFTIKMTKQQYNEFMRLKRKNNHA